MVGTTVVPHLGRTCCVGAHDMRPGAVRGAVPRLRQPRITHARWQQQPNPLAHLRRPVAGPASESRAAERPAGSGSSMCSGTEVWIMRGNSLRGRAAGREAAQAGPHAACSCMTAGLGCCREHRRSAWGTSCARTPAPWMAITAATTGEAGPSEQSCLDHGRPTCSSPLWTSCRGGVPSPPAPRGAARTGRAVGLGSAYWVGTGGGRAWAYGVGVPERRGTGAGKFTCVCRKMRDGHRRTWAMQKSQEAGRHVGERVRCWHKPEAVCC